MKRIIVYMLLYLIASPVFSQNRTVSGTVKDNTGNVVSFATVTETGKTNSVSADVNGAFSIIIQGNSTLTISASGFQSQTITPTGLTTEIILSRSEGELQEVVVTALGIRRADKALGYSVAKINPDNLLQKSEPDVLKGLQGKVAGVDIRSSQGTPGAATRIQIRGNNSFFGNSQPLIIVDGIPYSNDQVTTTNQTSGGGAYTSGLSSLDPNDIADFTVLKGSSAAALYGSRASNGVILITTKSGSSRVRGSQVTFKSSVSAETIANYPDYQNEYGAGSQLDYSNANGSWGPAFRNLDSIAAWPTYQAAYPDLFPSANIAYQAYPDNVKDLFRTGMVYENSLGFNSANEKSSVGLTVSQLTHDGYVPNSSYKRANMGLGASTKLDIGLNIGANFSYARSNQTGGFFGENQVSGVSSLFARSLFLARNWDLNLPFEDLNGLPLIPNVTGWDNPRWSAKYNTIKTAEERFVAGVNANFNLTPWARIDYSIGTNVALLHRREVTEIGSRAAEGVGRLVVETYRNQEIESNFLITLTPEISENFTLRTIIGNNINQRTITDEILTGNEFIAKGVYTLANTSKQAFTDDFYSRRRLMGVFADATLGYKNFAFLTATVRNDWSSTLPEENRSYLYPSISASFVFTDAFGIQSDVLDFGKIRAGWAKVGRDAAPYQLRDIYTLNPNFLGQPTASLPRVFNNPDLLPEFTKEIELGTQLSFFKRRAELDFTWYDRTSTNQIATIAMPLSSGYEFRVENFGGINNKGIEIDLLVRPVRTQNFNWDLKGVFTRNRNTVTELTSGVERIQLAGVLAGIGPYLEPGLPFGYLRGTVSARDDEGNLLIDPATGWIIEASDEAMVGDPNPDFKLGINNTLSYKGIFLSALWDMTKGGDLYSVTVSSLLGRGVTKDTRDREAAWIIPGVYGDANTQQPILDAGKKIPNQTAITTNDLYFSGGGGAGSFAINSSTEWNVYDATVYRLREVTLGYDLPKSLFNKLPISAVTISLSGRNLWHLAPNMPRYTNFDPEVNSFGSSSTQGIELSAAPTTRRFGFNLNVSF
ncbi:MAG: SusC/RagA family TonB-linked outer membrane protein [Chitinophagaceae bacterium]|nr:SusC/RagA family TonB-linked outer membrane protein [Chitinophagaceae bacterium]